jgi:hypothetical protein
MNIHVDDNARETNQKRRDTRSRAHATDNQQ